MYTVETHFKVSSGWGWSILKDEILCEGCTGEDCESEEEAITEARFAACIRGIEINPGEDN